ncbi:MAG: aryl-sulfate sulfotransferase [Bacteroidales bacterium]|nr:aryl-sulfate sulfotransferase [Bacteroidales bacterium]
MKKIISLLISTLLILGSSAQSILFSYVCPVPGSLGINPEQVPILKTGFPFDKRSLSNSLVTLTGSISGYIPCKLELSEDLQTLFIKPDRKFAFGETIEINLQPWLKSMEGENISEIYFSFTTREQPQKKRQPEPGCCAAIGFTPLPVDKGVHRLVANMTDNNLPSDYPAPTSVYMGNGIADSYIFFTPSTRLTPQYNEYLSIWDNYGTPVFYQKINEPITDFKVLDEGILTFAVNGRQNQERDCYYLMDSNYDIYDSVRAGNGYYIDNHDILLLENGHYLILIYDIQVVNMSQIVPGGNPAAQVTGLVIQEVDLNRNVYFQWRSWDHFEITDATWDISLTSPWIDYVHANALDLDSDGNILISSRNMDEVTKISYSTGDVIWRLGLNAKNNQFNFLNDPIGFSHQHDIRKLSNGNYTVYDNGNLHIPPESRALEYNLDEVNMTALLVWGFQYDPDIYAPVTGSNQRLPNNNRLIGWGGHTPLAMTEVNSNNEIVFELYLPDTVTGYRSLRYPWESTVFSTEDNVDFGNYHGYMLPKKYLLQIVNHYSEAIQITSSHNHQTSKFYSENLPVYISPGSSAEISLFFKSNEEGQFKDVLTLNFDNEDNTKRIACQLDLKGMYEPNLPSVQFNPVNGSVNVDPNTAITVTFSEPVRKILGQELKDADVPNLFIFKESNIYGNPVSFTGTVSEDKTTITIIPDQELLEQQRYFIRQKANLLENYYGNLINYSDFCFFTTGFKVYLDDPHPYDEIRIFPNPVKDMMHITSSRVKIEKVEIFSEDGRLLYTRHFNQRDISINIGHLPVGMYAIHIHTRDNYQVTRQVVRY